MSDARALLAEADRLRQIADRATKLSAAMSVDRNGTVEIGRTTLYQHHGYPNDLVLINAMRGALDALAHDHATRADAVEARVEVQP